MTLNQIAGPWGDAELAIRHLLGSVSLHGNAPKSAKKHVITHILPTNGIALAKEIHSTKYGGTGTNLDGGIGPAVYIARFATPFLREGGVGEIDRKATKGAIQLWRRLNIEDVSEVYGFAAANEVNGNRVSELGSEGLKNTVAEKLVARLKKVQPQTRLSDEPCKE